jgi:NAD(P)-dependent dehydrogenase (short-subunit alcohol dehydrogenase family)
MDLGLNGKIALVTGAATGLGYTYAEALVKEGVQVVLTDLDGPGAEKAALELSGGGGKVIGFGLDVGRQEDITGSIERTVVELGGIDILVNNAGLARGRWQALSDLSFEEWETLFRVNVASMARLAQAARPHMIARGGGVIVNQSSNSAYFKLSNSYAVSKLAVSGLTIGLAEEFEPDNIRVNGIAPGMMTGRMPQDIIDMVLARQVLKRRGKHEDLVGALLYLCSDLSSFVTGQTLLVDGGAALRV